MVRPPRRRGGSSFTLRIRRDRSCELRNTVSPGPFREDCLGPVQSTGQNPCAGAHRRLVARPAVLAGRGRAGILRRQGAVASSATGAGADITRYGGKVTITSICSTNLWRQILKSCLKNPRNPASGRSSLQPAMNPSADRGFCGPVNAFIRIVPAGSARVSAAPRARRGATRPCSGPAPRPHRSAAARRAADSMTRRPCAASAPDPDRSSD